VGQVLNEFSRHETIGWVVESSADLGQAEAPGVLVSDGPFEKALHFNP